MYTGQAPHPGKHVCPKHICRHGQPFATYFIFLEASVEPGTLVVSAAAFAFWYSCEMGASPVVRLVLRALLHVRVYTALAAPMVPVHDGTGCNNNTGATGTGSRRCRTD